LEEGEQKKKTVGIISQGYRFELKDRKMEEYVKSNMSKSKTDYEIEEERRKAEIERIRL